MTRYSDSKNSKGKFITISFPLKLARDKQLIYETECKKNLDPDSNAYKALKRGYEEYCYYDSSSDMLYDPDTIVIKNNSCLIELKLIDEIELKLIDDNLNPTNNNARVIKEALAELKLSEFGSAKSYFILTPKDEASIPTSCDSKETLISKCNSKETLISECNSKETFITASGPKASITANYNSKALKSFTIEYFNKSGGFITRLDFFEGIQLGYAILENTGCVVFEGKNRISSEFCLETYLDLSLHQANIKATLCSNSVWRLSGDS